MNSHIITNITALREVMRENSLEAFIIPSTDPHLSEYVAPHWQSREWISGFDGSAGTIVVTTDSAFLYTDSRYFLQAEKQLDGTGIILMKEGISSTPSISELLAGELQAGDTVGCDGMVCSYNFITELKKQLDKHSLHINIGIEPFEKIWGARPSLPKEFAFVYPDSLSGENPSSKRDRIMTALNQAGANATFLSMLDEIAWSFDLRGSDVEYNPVVISFAFISEDENIIFIDEGKLTSEVKDHLREHNITTASYEKAADFLKNMSPKYKLLIDTAKTNAFYPEIINPAAEVIKANSPVAMLKAIKNETEIEGFRKAMVKDGVALVKFYKWLEENVETEVITEMSASAKLLEFRECEQGFVTPSFSSIVGYEEHGAIVHYEATSDTDREIKNKGFLLIDSGGQYFDGTTDITRTIIMGEPTREEKEDFTLVLKGHIALAMAQYPAGTRGDQLDILARQALWNKHYNFLHGTGHGIGHFLNVHEGPQSIRMNHNPVTLIPGMITSNEPGLYLAGKYGIRHENLILTVKKGDSDFGEFLGFETLTLFPFDANGIDTTLLSPAELKWLNDYHVKVYDSLSSYLNEEEKEWLREKTKTLL